MPPFPIPPWVVAFVALVGNGIIVELDLTSQGRMGFDAATPLRIRRCHPGPELQGEGGVRYATVHEAFGTRRASCEPIGPPSSTVPYVSPLAAAGSSLLPAP